MATVTANKAPSNLTDAQFRAWAQFIYDAFVTTGTWVDTAATGSITIASASRPTVANTYVGFTVFRMADSLQATYPCFVKMEYGNGNVANRPQVRITVGTAHDGAGTLTGSQVSAATACGSNVADSATLIPCYASGTTSRIGVAMFVDDLGTSQTWGFSIERSKDSAGADNGDGIVFLVAGSALNATKINSIVIPPSGGVPPLELKWTIPVSKAGASSEYNSVKAVGLVQPWMGRLLRPVMSWGALALSDVITTYSTIAPTVYGASHTYLSLGSATSLNAADVGGACRLLLLYE